jgi:hypothetical protein
MSDELCECCAPGCNATIIRPKVLCTHHFFKLTSQEREELRRRNYGWSNRQAAINWAVECLEMTRKAIRK